MSLNFIESTLSFNIEKKPIFHDLPNDLLNKKLRQQIFEAAALWSACAESKSKLKKLTHQSTTFNQNTIINDFLCEFSKDLDCFEPKYRKIAYDYYHNSTSQLTLLDLPAQALYDKLDTCLDSTCTQLLRCFNLELAIPYWKITDQDVADLGYTGQQPNPASGRVCYDFAFTYLKEKQAAKYLLFYADFPEDFTVEITTYLYQWDYGPVKQPLSGDLIVYFNKKIATHFGVVTENGAVLSKFGRYPHIVKHAPTNIPDSYGSQIAYFRKERK